MRRGLRHAGGPELEGFLRHALALCVLVRVWSALLLDQGILAGSSLVKSPIGRLEDWVVLSVYASFLFRYAPPVLLLVLDDAVLQE